MLALYLIEGIILTIDDAFGKGVVWADDWVMWLFCWWLIGIYCIIGLPIKLIKRGIKR
jgi:hypothetical protein